MCGAMVSVAAALLASPLADGLPVTGVGLLLFLLYPLLDFSLLLLLVGQLVSGARGRGRDSVLLLGGTGLLVGLDLHYAVQVAGGAYYATLATDVLYGVAFGLLATGASAVRSAPAQVRRDRSRAQLVVLAAVVALATLALRPPEAAGVLVTVPAILTLGAVVLRLTVALREAQGAAEAVRLSRTDELTGLHNRRALLEDLRAGLEGARPPRCCSWTSTGSRRSTTGSGTPSATSCCRRSPAVWCWRCPPARRWPASAATSSRPCCAATTTSSPAARPTGPAGGLPARRGRRGRPARRRLRRHRPAPRRRPGGRRDAPPGRRRDVPGQARPDWGSRSTTPPTTRSRGTGSSRSSCCARASTAASCGSGTSPWCRRRRSR